MRDGAAVHVDALGMRKGVAAQVSEGVRFDALAERRAGTCEI